MGISQWIFKIQEAETEYDPYKMFGYDHDVTKSTGCHKSTEFLLTISNV